MQERTKIGRGGRCLQETRQRSQGGVAGQKPPKGTGGAREVSPLSDNMYITVPPPISDNMYRITHIGLPPPLG